MGAADYTIAGLRVKLLGSQPMHLYDSLSHSVQPLQAGGSQLLLYVCGITPYDTTHLGHAFTYTSVDLLVRLLETQGNRVRYVQNVTDVDDDLLREAAKRGQDWRRLGDRWTARFIEDMTALNVRAPDHLPRASSVIGTMIEQVLVLLEAGVAYAAGGGVYFEIDRWPGFGSLSGLPRDEMLPIANQRGNYPDDPNKRDPLDFVLWQPQSAGEPAWDSPWGPGRPGWHLECSTLAHSLLGPSIDLHVGGADLIFPHHECEIAQSEATGLAPFSRHWMHVAMLEHQGEKMSKSLGNLVLVRDLLEQHSPDAVRLYLAGHHYRKAWEHDAQDLDKAGRLVEVLQRAMNATGGTGPAAEPEADEAGFIAALEDDLDSPRAIEHLLRLADAILAAAGEGREIEAAQRSLGELGGILGLRLGAAEPGKGVVAGWRKRLSEFNAS